MKKTAFPKESGTFGHKRTYAAALMGALARVRLSDEVLSPEDIHRSFQAGFLAHGSSRLRAFSSQRDNGICGALTVHSDRIAEDSNLIPYYLSKRKALGKYPIFS